MGVTEATNGVRECVIRSLAAYVELAARMRAFERMFDAQVLHTASRLREIAERRRLLEADRDRIRAKVARGEYASRDELDADVREALTEDADQPGTVIDLQAPEPAPDEGFDEPDKQRIVRAFKQVVLPRVHADTSDTPASVFEVAFAAYRSRDYVLMEAFVIRYAGPVAVPDREQSERYEAAARRLDRRLAELRRKATADELADPERARSRMARQQEEFRRAIDAEAERIQRLRDHLEALRCH